MHGSTRSWAMTQAMPDDLWRDFPKTATEFEARFATEEDCRAYWIEARWGGEPACARCNSTRVWTIREGTTFECADCGHQTSLTSGTLLEKTRKPFRDVLIPTERHPACRQREARSGSGTERENLAGDGKGKGASGSHREAESTDVPERGGLSRSSDAAAVMAVERRGWVIVVGSGQPATGRT